MHNCASHRGPNPMRTVNYSSVLYLVSHCGFFPPHYWEEVEAASTRLSLNGFAKLAWKKKTKMEHFPASHFVHKITQIINLIASCVWEMGVEGYQATKPALYITFGVQVQMKKTKRGFSGGFGGRWAVVYTDESKHCGLEDGHAQVRGHPVGSFTVLFHTLFCFLLALWSGDAP